MSTKVYDAYLFNGKTTDLMPFLKKVTKDYKEFCLNTLKYYGEIEHITVKRRKIGIDKRIYLKDAKTFDILKFIEERVKEGYRDALNLDSCAMVYFHKDKIYIQFFGNHKFMEEIRKYDLLQDYHYQNSTDKSNYDSNVETWEEMSKERKAQLTRDWNKRKTVWNEIFDTSYPALDGLTYNFYNKHNIFDVASDFIQYHKEQKENAKK